LGTDPTATIALVRRIDGTVWISSETAPAPFQEVTYADGSPLLASAVSSGGGAPENNIGCAIVGGAVWCFPLFGSLSDSTYLGAGLDSSDVTSSPVQVTTSTAGTPLEGAQQIAERPDYFGAGATTCAVTADGSVWCWGLGYWGELGNGDQSDANYARQVLTDATTPFTDAVEVRLGYQTACARKTDGTVWCWGGNDYGELGTPSDTVSQSSYPMQISFPAGGSQQAIRLVSGPDATFCALMQDSTVVCWGDNDNNQAGATEVADAAAPTLVLTASGGPPLSGVIDIADDAYTSICARTESLGIVCWGTAAGTSPYPVPYVDGSQTSPTMIRELLAGGIASLGYVNANGVVTLDGTALPYQPTCDNLVP
jgi:hypothetical protein